MRRHLGQKDRTGTEYTEYGNPQIQIRLLIKIFRLRTFKVIQLIEQQAALYRWLVGLVVYPHSQTTRVYFFLIASRLATQNFFYHQVIFFFIIFYLKVQY